MKSFKEQKMDGATSKELMETANKLSKNPQLRRQVEEEVRKNLDKNQFFYIDNCGFGHFSTTDIHISSRIK